MDVTTTPSVEELREAVVQRLGRVDILVNAAGRTLKKTVNETTDAEWATILDTNLMGMVRGCRAFHAPLKASGRGRVINLGSLAAYAGFCDVGPYNAAKAAVLSLTQTLCIEWAVDQITVNALIPGVFPTELNASLLTGTDRGKELITAHADETLRPAGGTRRRRRVPGIGRGELCDGSRAGGGRWVFGVGGE